MENPDQLKTPAPAGERGLDGLDDFLWEAASWDPAVEERLEEVRDPVAAVQQLLEERLLTEPGTVYRAVRLLAETGALDPDSLAARGRRSSDGIRRGSVDDPLGTAIGLVGRATELSLGRRWATYQSAGVSVLCVSGPTGVGKTRLAREIVAEICRDKPVRRVEISLSCAAPGMGNRRLAKTPHDALAELLTGIGVREADMPSTLEGRRARYAAEMADRRPVILLDGVLDESQVLPLLPPMQGSVVVTSRRPLPGLSARRAEQLPLTPLSPVGSRLLVQSVFQGLGMEPDDRAATAIYDCCAGLPGPTIVASRWMVMVARTERLPFETLIERLHAATAFGFLGDDQLAVVQALGLLQVPEADIWTVRLSTGLSQERARAALEQLAGIGLVSNGERDQTWVLAPFAADARALLPGHLPEAEFERMLCPVIGMYGRRAENLRAIMAASLPGSPVQALPGPSPALRAWAEARWQAEHACVVAVLGAAAGSSHPALAHRLATVFMDLAPYGEARECGWREAERSVDAVLAVAGDAGDHQLEAGALEWLEHHAPIQGQVQLAAAPPAGYGPERPAEELTAVEQILQREAIEAPAGPLLFGARAGRP
jgi:hypothetical protein